MHSEQSLLFLELNAWTVKIQRRKTPWIWGSVAAFTLAWTRLSDFGVTAAITVSPFCFLPASPWRPSGWSLKARAKSANQDGVILDLRTESQGSVILNIQKNLCISSPSAQGTQVRASLPCPSSPGSFSPYFGVLEVMHFKQWGSRTVQFSNKIKIVYIWF